MSALPLMMHAIGCGGTTLPGTDPVPRTAAADAGADSPTEAGSPNHSDAGKVGSTPDASSEPATLACATAADCNGGSCFDGICMCPENQWVQTDGRCSPTAPPSCAAQGGTCETNVPGAQKCPNGNVVRSSRGGCGDSPEDVCCIDRAQCKGADKVTDCYVRGTDAAYVPVCINGWMTCMPGDSPNLNIGGR
jgi:hypothetical protein